MGMTVEGPLTIMQLRMQFIQIEILMKKILLKILEGISYAGMVVFLGFLFLIELIDLFLIRPITKSYLKRNVGGEYDSPSTVKVTDENSIYRGYVGCVQRIQGKKAGSNGFSYFGIKCYF